MQKLVVLVLSAAMALALPAEAQTVFGPLATEEAGPLQRVGLTHMVEGADLVGPGVVQAESWIGYSNIFATDSSATHRLFLDLESLSTDFGLRWGVTERFEAGGRLSFETTGGGILDPVIQAFHHTLRLPNANRAKYPEGRYAQRLIDGGRLRLDVPQRTMSLEDVRLFAKWRAWQSPDGRRVVSVSGTARLPTVDNLVGSRRADVALMGLARVSGTRWHLHAAAGGETVRAAQDASDLLRPVGVFADVGLERRLRPWVSGVAQLSLESSRLKGFGDSTMDGWPINLVFGVTGQVRKSWRVDLSFKEDVRPDTPAADFTLGVGIRRRW